MAYPTLLTYIDQPGTVPATYALPPGYATKLNSVSATFNGAGASGTFLACLSVYSQDNRLIGRFFPAQTFTAGDTGEVTYAPFSGDTSRATIGPGLALTTGSVNYANTTQTAVVWTNVITNDAGWWNAGAPTIISPDPGFAYLVTFQIDWVGGGGAGVRFAVVQDNAGNEIISDIRTVDINFTWRITLTGEIDPNAGETFTHQLYQNSGAGKNATASMIWRQLPA